MADQSLVESKFVASKSLTARLVDEHFPLAAAYWERREERGGWILLLVPKSFEHERSLIDIVSSLLIEKPFRSVFSLSDVFVESRMIDRARALGAYIRDEDYVGRPIDTTFTGGHYFESVVPIYFAPQLLKHVRVVP
jgi:hypothetical protein